MDKFLVYIIFTTLLLSFHEQAYAQKDTSLCNKSIATLRELNKQKKYKEAIDLWKETYKECKTYNRRVFNYGINIITYKIENEKDIDKRKNLVDSLMYLYNERIELFGREGFVRGRQGIDLMRYDKNGLEEAYYLLNKSLELQKLETEAAVVSCIMLASEGLFVKGIFDREDFSSSYEKCISNIDSQIKLEENEERKQILQRAYDGINHIYLKTGSPDCDKLVSDLTHYYEKNKNNVDRLEKLTRLLFINDCTDNELFTKVINRLDRLPPSFTISDPVPFRYLKKEKQLKKIENLKDKIEKTDNDTLKAKYFHYLATMYGELNEHLKSKELAYEAIECNFKSGAPYIFLAVLYVKTSEKNKENKFDKTITYCLAVDKLKKAKEIDPSVREATKLLIKRYSQNFPTKQEIKKQGLKIGQSYHIGGWINETTIVRASK